MKLNRTLRNFTVIILLTIFSLVSFQGHAQLDYSFTSYTQIAGTDLKVGAVYRFDKVKPGIDAIVTIKNFNNGASLDILDETGTGFDGAFQPRVSIGAKSKNSYVEFQIDFVLANTFIPMPQALVYVTAIDIDGHRNPGDTLQEFDDINLGVTSIIDFEALLGGLSFNNIGLWHNGKNINYTEYSGIDTLAKNVMYTVTGALVTSISLRSGGDNTANFTTSRQRSIIFERFSYPNSVLLPLPKLLSFTGENNGSNIALNWKFDTKDGLNQCVLERADRSNQYEPIAYFMLTDELAKSNSFKYTDRPAVAGNYSYRLKMISNKGEVQYSNIVSFIMKEENKNQLTVYPTSVTSSVTIDMNMPVNGQTLMHVTDMNGRIVKSQQLNMQKGNNRVTATGFDQLTKGSYVISVSTSQGVYSKQIIIH